MLRVTGSGGRSCHNFEASLGYTRRLCLKKQLNKNQNNFTNVVGHIYNLNTWEIRSSKQAKGHIKVKASLDYEVLYQSKN